MNKKISIVIISLVVAMLFMSGGYGYWRKDITIIGNITVLAPEPEPQVVKFIGGTGGGETKFHEIDVDLTGESVKTDNQIPIGSNSKDEEMITDDSILDNINSNQEIHETKDEDNDTKGMDANETSAVSEVTESKTEDTTSNTSVVTDTSTTDSSSDSNGSNSLGTGEE